MRPALILLAIVLLAGPAFCGDREFVGWWKHHDEQIQGSVYPERHYRRKKKLDFDRLREYQGTVTVPPGIAGQTGKAYVLFSHSRNTVLLVTPLNTMGNRTVLNEEFRRAMEQCSGDHSWIVTLPANQWTAIDLNPFCTMEYDQGQIEIDLYWANSSAWPLIDFITPGLTCIPHSLYGRAGMTRAYELKAGKCSGMRAFESYTGGSWHLLKPAS